ncbi:FMN-dependent dehydrogenase-domain-containing protein [Xylariomycetidae sp. FL0641]|nr:FMN-dependent dehydrogenase-domain-containing protein [Xylariomycetidae sp. FL0641]
MSPSDPKRLVSAAEVATHHTLTDLWLVIGGQVWDLSAFAASHPGGTGVLLRQAGRDASAAYAEVHAASLLPETLGAPVGQLENTTTTAAAPVPVDRARRPPPPPPPTPGPGSAAPPNCHRGKPPLARLLSAHDFAAAARSSLPPKAWAFAATAATDGLTAARNASAYAATGLRPRRTVGAACAALGIPVCVSTSASVPVGEVAAAVVRGEGHDRRLEAAPPPVFFQLYVDRDRAKSEALLRTVRGTPGVRAVFLTVDAPVVGKREADERIRADEAVASPMTQVRARNDRKGGALGRVMGSYIDASLRWADLAWLRRHAPGLPLVLKGVQTSVDAVRAMDAGVDAIYISNHGGRSLDTAPATVLVLLELQKNCPEVFERMEVYVDGGITRGTDIFKALCLGARAVGIGRGFLYALNYGKEGIEHFVNNELQTTMQQCGVTSLDQVHPGLLNTGAVDHLVPGPGEDHPYAKWRPRTGSKL